MQAVTIDGALSTLTEDAVERIAAIEDPALRNLWITQTYAELAQRLLDLLETDQTWCTFAIWASNTAGESIRDEELPKVLDELFGSDHDGVGDAVAQAASAHHRLVGWLIPPLHRCHVEQLVRRALDQVSEHIAHGNTLVYRELAPLFVRFLRSIEADGRPAPDEVDSMLRSIGVPDDDPLVWTAFAAYGSALGASDEVERAQLVLTGNIAAVLHEQKRLQDDVAAALDAGLFDVGGEVGRLCHRAVPGWLRRWIARQAQERAAKFIERLWDHVATRTLMTLATPFEVLHLGVDVPAPPRAHLFPPALERLDHPPLVELMAGWDGTNGTGRGSGARDWSVLHDRMSYIVNLFRSRQQVLGLTRSPFTDDQLQDMAAGRIPAGI